MLRSLPLLLLYSLLTVVPVFAILLSPVQARPQAAQLAAAVPQAHVAARCTAGPPTVKPG